MLKKSMAEKLHIKEYFIYGLNNVVRGKLQRRLALATTIVFIIWNLNATPLTRITSLMLYIAGLILFILFNSLFFKNIQLQRGFNTIHFENKAGDFPYVNSLRNKQNGFVIGFISNGIPLETWEDKITTLENVFDVTIFNITKSESNKQIYVHYCNGLYDFYKVRYFKQEFLDSISDDIILGVNGLGLVSFSFRERYHLILGGSTGTGKSNLIKSILIQSIFKGYQVILCDFKMGVDFPYIIRNKCTFVCSMADLYEELVKIQQEMNNRLAILSKFECKSVDEYNRRNIGYSNMDRIVVFIEEFADIADNRYLSKEDKDLGIRVLGIVNDLARKGRASNISLIVSTQRPDANVIPSTIKTNLLYRISGLADPNLSQIILDNSDAASRIPSDTKGVFLDSDSNLFKAFYVPDSFINEIDW